eukprot:13080563-Heterocapsa_arctica.AAC.1
MDGAIASIARDVARRALALQGVNPRAECGDRELKAFGLVLSGIRVRAQGKQLRGVESDGLESAGPGGTVGAARR